MTTFIVIFSIIVVAVTLAYILWDAFRSKFICDECFHRMYVIKIIDTPYDEIRVLKCPKCGFERKIVIAKRDD